MGYIVDYDELCSLEQKIRSKCEEWLTILGKTSENADALAKANSVQGDLANSVGAYMKEVHSFSLGMVMTALNTLRTRTCLYWDEYRQNIDSNYHAHIREDDLKRVRQHFSNIIAGVTDVDDAMSRAVRPISDLIYLTAPSPTGLLDALDEVRNRCRRLEENIAEHESSHASSDFEDIDTIITQIQNLIESRTGNKRVRVLDYQPGMVTAMTDMNALAKSYESICDYENSVKDELSEALEREEQMLQDLEDERQWAKWLAAGICVLGSIFLIAVTAGTASPLICAGVGAAVGLASAAASDFADNYVENGSFVEGMDWTEFGKDCVIGTVTGAVAGFTGASARSSSVIKPMEKVMMNMSEGFVENGSEGLINFVFDVGEAIVADDATFGSIITAASDSAESMMKGVVVGMAADAVGGYVGAMNDLPGGKKGFWKKFGEETIENMAEKEAQIGTAVTFDVVTGFGFGDSGEEIISAIGADMQEGIQDFVGDEVKGALASGIDKTIDSHYKDTTDKSYKAWRGTLKTVSHTATDAAGTFLEGFSGQILNGEEVDMEKLWREDMGGGSQFLESFSKGLEKGAADELYKDRKFQNKLMASDTDGDGRVEVVTFKNYSGYSVLKEDYDAAVEMAGTHGYEGKRAQDILGVPRNVSFSDDNIEMHEYKPSSLKKSDYSGKGKTNATKVEHK